MSQINLKTDKYIKRKKLLPFSSVQESEQTFRKDDLDFVDFQIDHEKSIRQHVFSVFNLTRSNFDKTPHYNDFLEKREKTINSILSASTENEKKRLQDELMAYESDNFKLILECQQKIAKENEEEIKDIVRKEGTFYEFVHHSYQTKCFCLSKFSSNLMHSLQRSHAELFCNDSEKDLNRENNGRKLQLFEMGEVPKPVEIGIVYSKIPLKIHTNKRKMYQACGMSKDLITKKIKCEIWGGLQLTMSFMP